MEIIKIDRKFTQHEIEEFRKEWEKASNKANRAVLFLVGDDYTLMRHREYSARFGDSA